MSDTEKDIPMIDMIAIAGIGEYRHYRRRCGCKTDEDRFYAEFGSSSLIRFGAWLTSVDLTPGKNRTAAARSSHRCGCGDQATFLVPR
jgi:hypothetical protein